MKRNTRFTPEEDQKLREVVILHDYKNWSSIGRDVGTGRDPMTYRYRWIYSLGPESEAKERFKKSQKKSQKNYKENHKASRL